MNYSIKNLKNKHLGERAFIVGLGPSLKISDLELLKNETTFCSNKVFLAFEQTNWRPTYYSITDELVARNNHQIIENLKLKKIFSHNVEEYFPNNSDILWINHNPKTKDNDGKLVFNFSKDVSVETFRGGTIVYFQLQLAFYMGFKEVYLLGVDFYYQNSKETQSECTHGIILESSPDDAANHFIPHYRKPGELWSKPDMERQVGAYKLAKLVFESNQRKLINLTPGSKLDVFERSELNKILRLK